MQRTRSGYLEFSRRSRRDIVSTKPFGRRREDLLSGGHLLLITNSGPLDVLGFIGNGERYEDVVGAASAIAVGDLAVPVLGIEALIEEKKALGRDKDLAVVRLLEAVQRRR